MKLSTHWIARIIGGVAAVCMVASGGISSTFAAERTVESNTVILSQPSNASQDQRKLDAMRTEQHKLEIAIARMEPHVRVAADGTFYLNIKNGHDIGVQEVAFKAVVKGMHGINADIRAGRIAAGDVKTHTPTQTTDSSANPSGPTALATCRGRSGTDFFWWGYRTYLNSCQVADLLDLMNAGAGASAICAAVFVKAAAPCGIVGGVLALGSVFIGRINRNGGDDGMYFNYLYNGSPVWISSQ